MNMRSKNTKFCDIEWKDSDQIEVKLKWNEINFGLWNVWGILGIART